MTTDLEMLAAEFGMDAACVLMDWAASTGRTIELSARPWRARGYTGARLGQLFVAEPGRRARLAVVKLLLPKQFREPGAHRKAWLEATEEFRPHLVEQVYDPVPVPGGGLLTFQAQAGHCDDWRPMAELALDELPAAAEAVTRAHVADWNRQTTVEVVSVAEFLRREVRSSGSLYREMDDVRRRSKVDSRVVEPLHLPQEESAFGRQKVNIICGRVHGDLHDRNVLFDRAGRPDEFVLVDLMTYESSGPLSRDLVRLLLSVTTRAWAGLSDSQRDLLLTAFVKPEAAPPSELPPVAVDIIRAVYQPAADLLADCGRETWRWQYMLTLVAHGMLMTRFKNLDPHIREWFRRLAERAGCEADRQLGQSRAPLGAARILATQCVPAWDTRRPSAARGSAADTVLASTHRERRSSNLGR
jgi:hypothetical protein